jgi:hypothetical protein
MAEYFVSLLALAVSLFIALIGWISFICSRLADCHHQAISGLLNAWMK